MIKVSTSQEAITILNVSLITSLKIYKELKGELGKSKITEKDFKHIFH